MAEQATLEKLRNRRLERMRLGQAAAAIEMIPSDPDVRVALVPLLEGEYDECMKSASKVDVPENIAGAQVMDREEHRQVILRAMREVDDYSKRVFDTADEMMEVFEPTDVNHLYECYLEMIREFSPRMAELDQEEVDFLSDLFENMPWSDLSGKQVYALSRFLSTLRPGQLTAKLPGRLLTP